MVLVLLKIKFGHAQISVPKIGIPVLKTACINPCHMMYGSWNMERNIMFGSFGPFFALLPH